MSPKNGKITEIAILLHDGEKVTEEYTSLLDPEVKIPYRITQITGINNKLVEGAPKFYEEAKKIVELTEGRTLVGHNVQFDYNFLRKEFGEFGYEFKKPLICTVRLSRKILPGRKSYALGKLTQELGISNSRAHRAMGDAKATTELFEQLLKIEKESISHQLKGLHSNLSQKVINGLPRTPGVYYFLNDKREVIYVGKSINIHHRVMSHLVNNTTKRAVKMRNDIQDVDYVCCGNELISLLKESHEIKKHMPLYNRAQRRKLYQWGLYTSIDEKGYLNLLIKRNDGEKVPLTSFNSKESAKNRLADLVDQYNLCQKLCDLYETKGSCFFYKLKKCNGACIGEEPANVYNQRVQSAIEEYQFENENFILVGDGRQKGEKAVVVVKNGRYLGYGFLDPDSVSINNPDELIDLIELYEDNKDVQQIIRSHLRHHQDQQIIRF